MTARLQRIHAILRAGHVPCALDSRPSVGTVLHAGTPDHRPWDVLLRDTGSELRIHHAGGADELPYTWPDTMVADAVKVRVVQAWADQGNPEAKALIAMLQDPSQPHHSAYRTHTAAPRQHVSPHSTTPFVDPLQLAAEILQAANRLGRAILTGRPVSTMITFSSPWGTYQRVHIRR